MTNATLITARPIAADAIIKNNAPQTEHEKAEALYESLEFVDLSAVPVVCTDRNVDLKDQARMARNLFKTLGLKGLSVTTPRYSMAQSVRIDIPRLQIHSATCRKYAKAPHEAIFCPTCKQNSYIAEMIEKILSIAFPNHNDRSDTMADHFDYCWSFR